MAMMTLQTLISEATALVGGRLDLLASQVSLYVNMAQIEVARALPHGEMEATTYLAASTSSATAAGFPSDFDAPIALSRISTYDTNSHLALTRVTIGEIDDASDSGGTAVGTTNRYALHSGDIWLYPKPSSNVSFAFRYRKVPTEMTATTSVPSVHTRYHPAILYKTAENLAMRSVNPELAAYYRNTYISFMQATPTTQELRAGSERQNTER
jgi:hypothetical protein